MLPLYQDDFLYIINKPSGSLVHKTPGAKDSPILLQLIRDKIGKKVYPLHRLDRGTSGCLAFSTQQDTVALFQSTLCQDSTLKKYTTLCYGRPKNEVNIINRPLSNPNKTKKRAYTKYRVIEDFPRSSLLDIELFTGRTHQIRRHLSHLGHHIIGDVHHGKGRINRYYRSHFNFHRLFLHCHFLSFIHPLTHKRVNLNAPLPKELQLLLFNLRKPHNKEDSSLS